MITVKTTSTTYQYIKDFKIWDIDTDYFYFSWSDSEYLILHKSQVLSIKGK